jgi:phosphoketolase
MTMSPLIWVPGKDHLFCELGAGHQAVFHLRAGDSAMDAYWRAANYLSVGQIYLYDNPLLKEPLSKEHIKPLLGHWGTTPGLSFIYVLLNRPTSDASGTS